MRTKIIILLFFGLLIRLLLVPLPGFEGDIIFWKSWSLAAIDKGVVWLATNTDYNYPAGFTLVLWLIGKIYQLFANPHNFQQYWQTGNYLFLLLAKMPSILADLGIAVIIFLLASQVFDPESSDRRGHALGDWRVNPKQKLIPLLLSALYLFNPVVLYDGVWWGQVDSFGVMFVFLCLLFILQKKPILASIAITVGFLLKMQNIIFLPLFFLYIWRAYSWPEMVKSLSAAFVTFVIVTLPFSLSHNLGRTFTLITQNSDWFPYLSLRAYNPWWLLTGGNWQASDKILTLGITSAKTLGLILFSGSYLLAGALVFKKGPTLERSTILAFTFAAFSFFLLPTQSHERYIFPAFALCLLLLPFILEEFKNHHLPIWLIFTLFSFTILINLNNSLIAFYPQNGIPFFQIFNQVWVELAICYFNLLVFLLFLTFVVRKVGIIGVVAAVGLVGAGILLINLPYLIKKEISLTQLKPLAVSQDYGSLQISRTLQSMAEPQNWGFLSVNYYFYRHGFATHTNSKIVFDLNRKFKRFATDMGIDSDAGGQASVVFEIYGDDKLLYSSKTVKKIDLPMRAEVSIEGIKSLVLVAKDAGDGTTDDHADWLEPVLYK